MAHHQHHGGHLEAPRPDKSIGSQPTSTGMPSISEDELAGEADEPPDHRYQQPFTKTAPSPYIRRPSLLTKALHTDTESHNESHDESLGFSSFNRQASRSSTCSTWSGKSDFTSDDGLTSNMNSPSNKSTAAMAPMTFQQPDFGAGEKPGPSESRTTSPGDNRDHHLQKSAQAGNDQSGTSPKPAVEDTLGRKRCISFACGGRESKVDTKVAATASARAVVEEKAEAKKRPCMLKFACPSKVSWKGLDKDQPMAKTSKHDSPPPPPRRFKSPSPATFKGRQHRDSDTTIRNESPKTSRKTPPTQVTVPEDQEPDRADSTAFHEFASADEPVEEWVQESTCHRSRLTVQDTLKKENDIRQIGEEAEEEALQEEDEDFDATSEGLDSDEDEESDAGFHSDDEEGFAESDDDDSEGDSDYEWWAPRRSSGVATMAPADGLRPPPKRSNSNSSFNSATSPKYRDTPKKKSKAKSKFKTEALPIRPATPELPDSTDFVCGTLDEDRPLEQAYASCLEQRKAAKHIARPQDIDPTFPTDIDGSDEQHELSDMPIVHGAREHHTEASFMHGSLDDMHGEELHRGRKTSAVTQRAAYVSPIRPHVTRRMTSPPPTVAGRKRSPAVINGPSKRLKSPPPATISKRLKSPPPPTTHKRLKSPPPPTSTASKRHKSPAPHVVAGAAPNKSDDTPKSTTTTRGRTLHSPPPSRPLFGHSPRCFHSPPAQRLTSPPPSRRGSPPGFKPQTMMFGTAFLGHRPQLTHTTSLPRSPNPLARRHGHLPFTPRRSLVSAHATFDDDADSEDDVDRTPHPAVSTINPDDDASSEDDDAAADSEVIDDEDDDDEASGNDTAREAATPTASTYTRGAIDIVQGLERKRLRRRMKFHEIYCRKEERKLRNGGSGGNGEARRPVPGRGAERMRQVGIECALYRGKRVLSV